VGPAPRSKVLVAVVHDNRERIARVLAGHDLTFVENSEQARSALDAEKFSLVILGVHFDESQMFSLLADIRSHAMYRKVPVLCVLGSWGRMLSDVAVEGLDHAVKAMMANGFLNLLHFADDDEDNARIRRIADYLILIDGDLQHIARATGERLEPALERRSLN
jgi:PleD family two-component response regulator